MKAYIVKYSTGEYDEYHVHDVAVCLSKTKAEELVKETNYEHTELVKPSWDDDTWDEITDVYYNELDKPSEETLNKYPNLFDKRGMGDFDNDIDFWRVHEKKIAEQDWLMEDVIKQFFPDWSMAKIREEIRIQENYDRMQFESYNDAWIDEIDIIE